MAGGNDKTGQAIVPFLQQSLPQHVLAGYMRYQKIRPLGTGGKAEVFLCRDQTLGREVAVKVLHPSLLESPQEQHMLVREARIMAALAHPGIPKIHDLGRDFEGRPYFAMSHVDGATLRETLHSGDSNTAVRTEQQYELERRVAALIDVGTILELAHSQHVVHGDLKPDNILIDGAGGIHLIDWGLATILQDGQELENEEVAFARERGRQGSPLYMSPEQAIHDSPPSEATDIYSMGVLLYECLTFATPFEGADADEVLDNILHADPVAPSRRTPNYYIPPDLERACLKALSKNRADRQANMSQFVAELRDCHIDLLIEYDRTALGDSVYCPAAVRNDQPMLAYV